MLIVSKSVPSEISVEHLLAVLVGNFRSLAGRLRTNSYPEIRVVLVPLVRESWYVYRFRVNDDYGLRGHSVRSFRQLRDLLRRWRIKLFGNVNVAERVLNKVAICN